MKIYFIFLLVLNISPKVFAQSNDSIPVFVRGLKDYRISGSDSILIKQVAFGINLLDIAKINRIPTILKDCNISLKTKLEIANLLVNSGKNIDTSLFKVIGDLLFFIDYGKEHFANDDNFIQNKSRFFFLEQISTKTNVTEFSDYVLKNNLLDKCALYSEDCSYPRDCVDIYSQSEYFLSRFAEICSMNDITKIDTILQTTSNNCIYYNLSRIKFFLKKDDKKSK
ncbi:MAG: hypothetical protein IPJ51_15650 [Saprospiraceae bacterium]|nr:hypothetical protein [Saprospiraceae bacterium]